MITWKEKPCKNFNRYKGKRRPTCGCWPCMERFIRCEVGRLTHQEISMTNKQIPSYQYLGSSGGLRFIKKRDDVKFLGFSGDLMIFSDSPLVNGEGE